MQTVEKKRKSLQFAPVTSFNQKMELIKLINDQVAKSVENDSIPATSIPYDPMPNISFWISTEEKRCGLTITRENCKWGWRYDSKKWVPCSYMSGMGFDNVDFGDETNKYLVGLMYDVGRKLEFIEGVARENLII